VLKSIYKKFNLDTWQQAESYFKDYISMQENYTKNKYQIYKEELEKVLREWDFAMKAFGYEVPDNLEVV
jgi:hypothetical protein